MSDDLVIRRSRKGRGVYAGHRRVFRKGETIEVSHVITVHSDIDVVRAAKKWLVNEWVYCFPDGRAVIALGNGSLYNHSYDPNAAWACRQSSMTIRFYAFKDIAMGSEITINYNGTPNAKAPMDFKVLS